MLLSTKLSGKAISAVQSIQEMLNFLGFRYRENDGTVHPLAADGDFGPKTESVVIDFQRSEGLLADGIVGPSTMQALEDAYSQRVLELNSPGADAVAGFSADPRESSSRFALERVPADRANETDESYERLSLRADAADAYLKVQGIVNAAGGILTSSGGIRNLNARLTRSRSATSFHYLGLALDLYIYSAMVDPRRDPYVVQRNGERDYRIYARCSTHWNPNATLPDENELPNAITYRERKPGKPAKGHFLDLTGLFDEHGFKPIRARRRFEEGGSMMGAEWWHFQYEKGLVRGVTTFGSQLLKIYSRATLQGTPPWQNRDRVFGVNWS